MHSSGPESSHDLFSIDDNPYQAPQSAPEPPAGALDEKRTRWFRVGAILQIIAIILGTVAAFVDIESIVVSGPIVLVLGLITAILALRCRHDDGFAFGLAFGLSGPGHLPRVLPADLLFGMVAIRRSEPCVKNHSDI